MNMAAAMPTPPDTPRPAPGRPEKLRLGDVLVQQLEQAEAAWMELLD